jgi:hypothetical protein
VGLFACELIPAMRAPTPQRPKIYYTKLVKLFCVVPMADSATQLQNSGGRSHHGEQHLVQFQIFCIVPVTDSATQHLPHGGFRHAATKIAAGAPIEGIRSQAKRTTAKLKYLKFMNENEF